MPDIIELIDVRMPDGRIVKNVPEGTTQKQLSEKLDKFDRRLSGPAELRRQKWQEIADRGLQDNFDPDTRAKFDEAVSRGLITLPDKQISDSKYKGLSEAEVLELEYEHHQLNNPNEQSISGGVGNELLQGATLGLSDEIQSFIAAAISSPFISDKTFNQLMLDARNSIRADQEQFRQENPKTALAANVVGGLVVPGGVALNTTKSVAKAGSVTGAIAGAGFSDSEEFISMDTAIDSAVGGGTGAVAGVVLQKAISSATSTIRNLIKNNQIQVFDDAGRLTDDALYELRKMEEAGQITSEQTGDLIRQNQVKDGVLTIEQAKRFNLFQSRGVTPTRANLTQSADDFKDQQSALKRTGEVSEKVAEQDKQLINLVDDGIDNIRPNATNINETNSSVFSVVDDVVTKADEAVGQAYQSARNQLGDESVVSVDKLINTLKENRGQNQISLGLIASVRTQLKNRGLIGEGARKISIKEAEEIRQFINSNYDSTSAQGKRLIRQLKDALDDDVASVVSNDVFAPARQAKVDFQKLIEKGKRNKFDKSRSGFLEDVIDNKIPEEKIVPKLLSGRDDDFIKFKTFLTKDAGESGKQAWDDIRAQVLRSALDKATKTMSKGEGGQSVFNVRLFRNELNKLKNSKKYAQLFNKDEQRLIDDIIEIGNLRIPVSSVSQGGGPSEVAIDSARREILKRIPIIGNGADDLLEAVSNIRTDKRLLNVTRETEAALR